MPSGAAVSFGMRCGLSMVLSLWLAFYLELDQPYWAMLNTGILIRPLPGVIVFKSIARIIGTLVAVTGAITFIALFAQYLELLIIALICWIALAVFIASRYRDNLQYACIIPGYVGAVIILKAISGDNPEDVFWIAVARAQETILAVIVVVAVSFIFSSGISARKYAADRLHAFKQIGEMGLALLTQPQSKASTLDYASVSTILSQILALESTRLEASRESWVLRLQSHLARRLNYEMLAIVGRISTLQAYIQRIGALDGQNRRVFLQPLRHSLQMLTESPSGQHLRIKHALNRAYQGILDNAIRRERAGEYQHNLSEWTVIVQAAELANRLRAVLIKEHDLSQGRGLSARSPHSRRPEFSTAGLSLYERLIVTARAVVAMSVVLGLWLFSHDQPIMEGAGLLLAIITTFFAILAPTNPVFLVKQQGIGLLFAGGVAFVIGFGILPRAADYEMMAMAIFPFMFVAGLAMINPPTMSIGLTVLVTTGLMLQPQNSSRPDILILLQMLIGSELAALLALVSFALIFPTNLAKVVKHRISELTRDMARHLDEPRERFETRTFDRLVNLPVQADDELPFTASQAAFSGMVLGVEMRKLYILGRHADFDTTTHKTIKALLKTIGQEFMRTNPRLNQVFSLQRQANQLAQQLLAEALQLATHARVRQGVRTAVSAELVASALALYGRAYDDGQSYDIQLGNYAYSTR